MTHCTYPDCNCPFDAPADPNWCARGLPKSLEQIAHLADLEREAIHRAVAKFNGDKPKAAKALGISLKTLYNRLNYYAAQEARAA